MLHPSTAGVEHYRGCVTALECTVPLESRTPPVEGPHPRNLHLGGTPIAMTIAMVSSLIPDGSPIWKIARRSPNSMEYEIAGTMLSLLSWPAWLIEKCDEWGWFEVPLIQWKDALKEDLIAVRRMGMAGTRKDDDVYCTRKLLNVTYRRDTPADWEKERANRLGRSWHKHLMSGKPYMPRLMHHAYTYERRQVLNISKRADYRDMRGWWARRHHTTPGGSTSAGTWARKLFKDDERMGQNDRPNKKSVVEALDDEAYKLLLWFPPRLVARASTKHEPADKRRALYAVNDIPYFVSSFASFNAEKEADMPGVAARQTPEDFLRWIADAREMKGYWLSSDYDDYNKEHTLEELALCNVVRAKAWLTAVGGRTAEQKAAAHMWLAEAIMSSSIEWPDGEETRVFCGMFSGQRDTMRDHCTIHNSDVRIIREDAADMGYHIQLAHPTRGENESGDDEDICFADFIAACIYAKTALAQGHELNPRKQMAGAHHHEFLQVQAVPGGSAQRPLSALLSTLATGNWYVPSATWFDSIIQGVSDNWWEAAVRGLPLAAAQHMAAAYLDTMMRVHDDVKGDWVDLEWWDYRSPGYKHPLWGVTTEKPPVARKNPVPRATWPSNATKSWIKCNARLLRDVPPRKIKEYEQSLLEASHGSAFVQYRQTQLRAEVRHNWPPRVPRRYTLDRSLAMPGFTMDEMAQLANSLGTQTAPRSEGEQAARMGLDPQIISLVGAYEALAGLLDGPSWSRYARVIPARELTERAWASSWAFRSWCMRTAGTDPRVHAQATPTRRLRAYIYAPNGAGKSWFVNRMANWSDIDAIARPIGLNKPSYREGRENMSERRLFLARVIQRAITDDVEVLLGQWDPHEVTTITNQMGIKLRLMAYDPGTDIRVDRLRRRGWTEEEIARRAKRWISMPETCRTPEELTAKLQS